MFVVHHIQLKKKNIYWEHKGKITIVLNSSLYESIFFELFIILIVLFFIVFISKCLREVTPKNYAVGYDRMYIRKI